MLIVSQLTATEFDKHKLLLSVPGPEIQGGLNVKSPSMEEETY